MVAALKYKPFPSPLSAEDEERADQRSVVGVSNRRQALTVISLH
jgi:hypothetical protein